VETGDHVVFVESSSALRSDALDVIGRALDDQPDLVLAYANESWPSRSGHLPVRTWKPEWSPERLRGHDYVGYPVVVSRQLAERVGGIRPEFGAVALHELVLRASEAAQSIVRLPEVLHHSADPARRADAATRELRERAVQEHLDRCGIDARACAVDDRRLRVDRVLRERPLVSIVIPTAGTAKRIRGRDTVLVSNCVRSIAENSSYDHVEILVVHDGPLEPTVAAATSAAAGDRVRFIPFSGAFNFSEKVNLGATAARGDVLILLNDDTTVISPNWIEVMLGLLEDPGVGIVGPKLLLADGRIQSAGHFNSDGAKHVAAGYPADEAGPDDELAVSAERSGITMACAAVRRDVFFAVGGLCVDLPRAYNDVDFCNKLALRCLRSVWTPWVELTHFESLSRDPRVTHDEVAQVMRRWGQLMTSPDPYLPHIDRRLAGVNYVVEDESSFVPVAARGRRPSPGEGPGRHSDR